MPPSWSPSTIDYAYTRIVCFSWSACCDWAYATSSLILWLLIQFWWFSGYCFDFTVNFYFSCCLFLGDLSAHVDYSSVLCFRLSIYYLKLRSVCRFRNVAKFLFTTCGKCPQRSNSKLTNFSSNPTQINNNKNNGS